MAKPDPKKLCDYTLKCIRSDAKREITLNKRKNSDWVKTAKADHKLACKELKRRGKL